MFIIEGPDGSGKTTLARKMASAMNAEVLHEGGPPKSYEEGIRRMRWQLHSFGKILDRAFIVSERIYGPIARGDLIVPIGTIEEYADWFVRDEWILIYCRPSNKTIIEYAETGLMEAAIAESSKTYKEDDHVRSVKNEIMKIIDAYDRLIDSLRKKGMEVLYHVRDKSAI